ncbi:hypothetical protein [Gemmatimonas sp.]|uniref:pilus assembly PilX N-terminal domain-containing protein n=1 Tax=Gemmatimonas sp. TaxID=1962908 RepID=UPI00286B6C8C|nr:hypothetical protein [Gemmatimonas sp.]
MTSNQTTQSPPAGLRLRKGFALEVVLLMLVMFSIIVLAGLSAVTTIARTSNADYRGARASYAAEGGADDIMSQLDAAMQDGIINGEDIASITKPEITGFRMTQSTSTTGVPVSRTITAGPFAGLYSLNQPIDITVSARDTSGNKATAVLSVNAQTIPLFQFGVFYEDDLEILPGAPMTFAGWVHTNGNLYLSSASATFQSNLTTPDSVFWNRKDASNRLAGVRINNAAGTGVLLDFDSRSLSEPAFKTRSEVRFNGRLMSKAQGVRPLKLPLPANVPAVTLVQPRSVGDSPMVQDVKMAWKSDWYITVNAAVFDIVDTNTMKAQLCTNFMVQERTGGLQVPDAAACAKIFKPRRNAFYEGREDLRPDLLDIHMDSLRIWSDASKAARSPRIIYVNFTNLGGNTNKDYVAVRLRQGAQLPKPGISADTGGLSMVTERPMYVLGDYNTIVWRPAAIMGDAITFLSNPPNAAMAQTPGSLATRCSAQAGWCDTLQTNYAKRTARPTNVRAALLVGHSPTPCDYVRAGCGAPPYGGGLENLPRFLEGWGGVTFTYTGSLVSLYQSRFAFGLWGNSTNPNSPGAPGGGYYDAPTRAWSFDVNFRFPERLPPGTPSVGTVLQTAFRPLY